MNKHFEEEYRLIDIEGRQVVVQIAPFKGIAWADFVLADRLRQYMDADREGDSPWFDMVGWKDMRAALSKVWKTILELAGDMPIGIEASDTRRARVYMRMLRRCGVSVDVIERHFDDTVLIIK